jgi:hypothetical protein
MLVWLIATLARFSSAGVKGMASVFQWVKGNVSHLMLGS